MQCPSCGANLQYAGGAACPECGVEFWDEDPEPQLPTEEMVNDWNIHNDHAGDGNPDEEV